ncbi:MAG: aminotransferase class III-fold pyridoxal phosphate-dependent enzyme [Chloroflexi bacterium]|nr:aminotransferase class III-fold pyridoxal phosphate-dependent enzyme [Chloroflexota bacterium]
MMTIAKPLAGGLPLGAALVTERVAAAIQPGDHGSTFAGGPMVCAAALHVFERINQPTFLAHAEETGA